MTFKPIYIALFLSLIFLVIIVVLMLRLIVIVSLTPKSTSIIYYFFIFLLLLYFIYLVLMTFKPIYIPLFLSLIFLVIIVGLMLRLIVIVSLTPKSTSVIYYFFIFLLLLYFIYLVFMTFKPIYIALFLNLIFLLISVGLVLRLLVRVSLTPKSTSVLYCFFMFLLILYFIYLVLLCSTEIDAVGILSPFGKRPKRLWPMPRHLYIYELGIEHFCIEYYIARKVSKVEFIINVTKIKTMFGRGPIWLIWFEKQMRVINAKYDYPYTDSFLHHRILIELQIQALVSHEHYFSGVQPISYKKICPASIFCRYHENIKFILLGLFAGFLVILLSCIRSPIKIGLEIYNDYFKFTSLRQKRELGVSVLIKLSTISFRSQFPIIVFASILCFCISSIKSFWGPHCKVIIDLHDFVPILNLVFNTKFFLFTSKKTFFVAKMLKVMRYALLSILIINMIIIYFPLIVYTIFYLVTLLFKNPRFVDNLACVLSFFLYIFIIMGNIALILVLCNAIYFCDSKLVFFFFMYF